MKQVILSLILAINIIFFNQHAIAKYYGQLTVNKFALYSITNKNGIYGNPDSLHSIFNPNNGFFPETQPSYNRYNSFYNAHQTINNPRYNLNNSFNSNNNFKNPYNNFNNQNKKSLFYTIMKEYPQKNHYQKTLKLYDSNGEFRGNLNNDPNDINSISNPYGPYGNPASPDSIHNPFGAGDPYLNDSPFNAYGQGWSIYLGPK